jgi:hypothetical protein
MGDIGGEPGGEPGGEFGVMLTNIGDGGGSPGLVDGSFVSGFTKFPGRLCPSGLATRRIDLGIGTGELGDLDTAC